MAQEMIGVRKVRRRLDAPGRAMRRVRILARLSEGFAYEDIAREEGVTTVRIRQIVKQALAKRVVDDGTDHAMLQIARLAPAMRLAGEAIGKGDVSGIAALLKVLDRLDRYQKVAKANQVYDDEARQKLMDKINRVAARLQAHKAREQEEAAALAAEAAGPADVGEAQAPAPAPASDEPGKWF